MANSQKSRRRGIPFRASTSSAERMALARSRRPISVHPDLVTAIDGCCRGGWCRFPDDRALLGFALGAGELLHTWRPGTTLIETKHREHRTRNRLARREGARHCLPAQPVSGNPVAGPRRATLSAMVSGPQDPRWQPAIPALCKAHQSQYWLGDEEQARLTQSWRST